MSNSFEENKETQIQQEETSTIFSAPTHEDEKVKKTGLLKKILVYFLVFAVVAGSAFAIKLLIPEKEKTESGVEEITLSVGMSKEFPKVEFISGSTTIVFKALEGEEYDNINGRDWYIEGIDEDDIDYTKTAKAINALGGLKAAKQVSTTVDDALYGFDNPKYVINFTAHEDANKEDYTVKVGDLSPDAVGRYVTLSNREGVYLVKASHFDSFEMNVLDFANVDSMGKIEADEDTTTDYYNSGTLVRCDKMEFYTKLIGKTYTFATSSGASSDLYNYDFISPERRPCDNDNIQVVVDVFANGITGDGAYSYSATSQELKKLGLDKPDLWATIYVEDIKKTIKASLQEDGKYAVVVDDKGIIGKVDGSELTFKDMPVTDYYNDLVLFESIYTIKTLYAKTGDEEYTFSITNKYDADAQSDTIDKVFCGDKELDVETFKTYYINLISLTAVDHNYVSTKGKTPETTMVIKHNNDSKDTDVAFYKVSDSRYQMEVGGLPVGLLSTTTYKTLVANTKNISQNKQ